MLKLKWDDKNIASAMNEYKLYNLEKQDKKKTSSYEDALKDKNILKLADEFDEDVSPSDN